MKPLLVACLGLFVILSGQTGRAAQIIRPPNSVSCTIELTGELQPGDEELFEKALTNAPAVEARTSTLCLDSIGGSYDAAIKIAEQLLTGGGFRTLVLSGQHCLSACAIVFMAGNEDSDAGVFLSRSVAPGGDLGFHAPYLTVPHGEYDEGSVDTAYSVASQQIARLIGLSMQYYYGSVVLPQILVQGALETSKDKLLRINNIMGAILADIDIEFPKSTLSKLKTDYKTACDNFISSIEVVDGHFNQKGWSGASAIFKETSSIHARMLDSTINDIHYVLLVGYPGPEESMSGCLLQVASDGKMAARRLWGQFSGDTKQNDLDYIIKNLKEDIGLSESDRYLQPWYMLPCWTTITK
jgi:hypothetical protein